MIIFSKQNKKLFFCVGLILAIFSFTFWAVSGKSGPALALMPYMGGNNMQQLQLPFLTSMNAQAQCAKIKNKISNQHEKLRNIFTEESSRFTEAQEIIIDIIYEARDRGRDDSEILEVYDDFLNDKDNFARDWLAFSSNMNTFRENVCEYPRQEIDSELIRIRAQLRNLKDDLDSIKRHYRSDWLPVIRDLKYQ